MKLNFDCRRFKKLASVRDERELSPTEALFMSRHVDSCFECRRFEDTYSFSLNLLRDAALEPSITSGFDERVARLVKVQSKRESLSYWSPALIGGAIACIAIFATLQIAGMPTQLKSATLPDGEVKRNINADRIFPSLVLEKKPRFNQ